jgi:GTPase involved in cell partitioning and DNA repair
MAISLKMSKQEEAIYKSRAKKMGKSLSEYIRIVLRSEELVVIEDLKVITKEIQKQGNNLNQLTRLAHQGGIEVVELEEVREQYDKIVDLLLKIEDERKRNKEHKNHAVIEELLISTIDDLKYIKEIF